MLLKYLECPLSLSTFVITPFPLFKGIHRIGVTEMTDIAEVQVRVGTMESMGVESMSGVSVIIQTVEIAKDKGNQKGVLKGTKVHNMTFRECQCLYT